ncbi:hypothetical protein Pint_21881 [Pistacia integerrima]|uniref:Uncharacterized protein n=1 Tax=Pistacia integerrima TaxID=434235 RepID=A0ACC0X8T3_9ROSI|nr:hypothetical protein Pint_21881 [Pistacia integerrima]
MAAALVTLFVLTFAVALSTTAADPDLLQDLCVADLNSTMKVNGYPCRKRAIVDDFFSDSLAKPGAINGCRGYQTTLACVQKIPGLNTLGVSLTRIDFAPGGLNPPHTHSRATEMVHVLNGALTVGFITANGSNLFSRPIETG